MGKKFLYRLYTFMSSSSFQNQAQHMSACNKTAASQMGGAAPPPTTQNPHPPCFYSHPCLPEKGSIVSSPCLRSARVVQIILLANGGLPPNPPAVFRPPMSAITKKYHAATWFAGKKGGAALFVCAPDIFRVYQERPSLALTRAKTRRFAK